MAPPTAPVDRSGDILQALWELDRPARVADVQEVLARSGHELAYTTVQTMLNRLVEQGRVERHREGRAFLYRPTEEQASVAGEVLQRVARRFFGGSRAELTTHLVGDLEPDELRRVRALIDEALHREDPPR